MNESTCMYCGKPIVMKQRSIGIVKSILFDCNGDAAMVDDDNDLTGDFVFPDLMLHYPECLGYYLEGVYIESESQPR